VLEMVIVVLRRGVTIELTSRHPPASSAEEHADARDTTGLPWLQTSLTRISALLGA